MEWCPFLKAVSVALIIDRQRHPGNFTQRFILSGLAQMKERHWGPLCNEAETAVRSYKNYFIYTKCLFLRLENYSLRGKMGRTYQFWDLLWTPASKGKGVPGTPHVKQMKNKPNANTIQRRHQSTTVGSAPELRGIAEQPVRKHNGNKIITKRNQLNKQNL